MQTVLFPVSFDRQRVAQRTHYTQAPVLPIKERKLNWVKVIGVIAPIAGSLLFVGIYGIVGNMDYDDAVATAQAVSAHRQQIVCSAALDPITQRRYRITDAQIQAESCK